MRSVSSALIRVQSQMSRLQTLEQNNGLSALPAVCVRILNRDRKLGVISRS